MHLAKVLRESGLTLPRSAFDDDLVQSTAAGFAEQ
jgi:hypothetical protein